MDKKCTIYRTVSFVGKKWTLLILLELYKGKAKWKRYSHLKKKMEEITPKVLSMRLKELENEKLITKKVDAKTSPIKCEYSLTRSGKDFIGIIKDMKKWSLKWKGSSITCRRSDCYMCKL